MELSYEIIILDKKLNKNQERLVSKIPSTFHFNSYEHLEEILSFSKSAAENYELSEDAINSIRFAIISLFNGLIHKYEDYVPSAVKYAETAIPEISEKQLNEVKKLIPAVNDGGSSLLENIVHDAWWIFLGKKKFLDKMELLRLEKEFHTKKVITAEEWIKVCLTIINSSNFLTQYGIKKYGKRRQKNLLKISKLLSTKKEGVKKKRGRGVETMYRAVYRNHINLSSIADTKANMMISINTIIMSVIITGVTGFSFTSNLMMQSLQYVIPVFVLLFASLASVVFAIISARPEVTSKKLRLKQPEKKRNSYLFFGNFVNMALSGFINRLAFYRNNQSELYDDMSIDIYYLGRVLDKKYKLLRIAYNIFMFGLILSVVSFVTTMIYMSFIT